MKTVVQICMLLTFLTVSCQKDEDESRPYEFGFTIDGQQHRHEKKDVNGIIQGEFGFITADGIYHVTVYATDENGNFRILSMKNIRISAPLDGSPLPPGAKIESYPGAGKIQTQPQTQVQQQPQIQQQPQPQVQTLPRIQDQNQPQIQPIQTTSRPRTTYAFTTQPTIKPACGGCGYVTTPKPRPGELFPFQIPAFRKPSQQSGTNAGQSPGQPETNYPAQPGPNYHSQQQNPQIVNPVSGLPTPEAINPQTGTPGSSLPTSGANYPAQDNSPAPIQGGTISGPQPSNFGSNYPAQSFANPAPNEIDVNRPRRPLSQVSVTDGVIHVPGNPDIAIRDKFPGMVDGLPEGITEKDITDLLYKFNYTVGFHGHYEKGLKNGAKVGGYFVTGRDGISRIVTYVADENGFRPKVKFVRLDLNSDEVPKEGTEKKFGLKNFEFIWYPVS